MGLTTLIERVQIDVNNLQLLWLEDAEYNE